MLSMFSEERRNVENSSGSRDGFFIFIFFIFVFEIYRNIPRPPRCRAAGTWPPGSGAAGALCKYFRGKNCAEVPGGRPPGSGAAGPGRPAVGRPALPPLYKGWLVPPPLICITKIPETKKKEGGRERGEALPDFRASDCR